MTPILLQPSLLDAKVEGRNLRPGSLRNRDHRRCWSSSAISAARSAASGSLRIHRAIGPTRHSQRHSSSTSGRWSSDSLLLGLRPRGPCDFRPWSGFYKALALPRASKLQLLDPRVWASGMRARRDGHKASRPVGDPFMMPGLFLVEGDHMTWKWTPTQMGGLPPIAEIPRAVVVPRPHGRRSSRDARHHTDDRVNSARGLASTRGTDFGGVVRSDRGLNLPARYRLDDLRRLAANLKQHRRGACASCGPRHAPALVRAAAAILRHRDAAGMARPDRPSRDRPRRGRRAN